LLLGEGLDPVPGHPDPADRHPVAQQWHAEHCTGIALRLALVERVGLSVGNLDGMTGEHRAADHRLGSRPDHCPALALFVFGRDTVSRRPTVFLPLLAEDDGVIGLAQSMGGRNDGL